MGEGLHPLALPVAGIAGTRGKAVRLSARVINMALHARVRVQKTVTPSPGKCRESGPFWNGSGESQAQAERTSKGEAGCSLAVKAFGAMHRKLWPA